MKAYELLYIIRPDLDDEAVAATVDKFSEVVNNNGGADVSVDKWGKRRLAYEINDYREGVYILMNFNGEARTAQEVERVMKISDTVVRFLTTKKEDK
jgi:small subunit ribosomal protein S6